MNYIFVKAQDKIFKIEYISISTPQTNPSLQKIQYANVKSDMKKSMNWSKGSTLFNCIDMSK